MLKDEHDKCLHSVPFFSRIQFSPHRHVYTHLNESRRKKKKQFDSLKSRDEHQFLSFKMYVDAVKMRSNE